MSKLRRLEPWRLAPQSQREVMQATYNRLMRRYKGLDPEMIRSAWRRHLDQDPSEQVIEGIRTGAKLRFQ